MASCYLSSCPQGHHRLRDVVRVRWAHLVSEWSPVWAVLVDDRPAIVAATREHLVVVDGDRVSDGRAIRFGQVVEVTAARSVVHLAVADGHRWAFGFGAADAATEAAQVIAEGRAGAPEARTGDDDDPQDVVESAASDVGIGRVVELPAQQRPDRDGEPAVDAPADAEPAGDPATGPGPDGEGNGDESVPSPRSAESPRDPAAGPLECTALAELAEFATRDLAATAEQPIEREVAWLLAQSGGGPIGQQPASTITIPAQVSAPERETVLMVTTEDVPGRVIVKVHGEALGLASPPVFGAPDRGVHDVARERLAQAVLRRGGTAVVGLRYWASVAVPGEVAAYGTAVTLAPARESGWPAGSGAPAG